jgi:hypothetical protein
MQATYLGKTGEDHIQDGIQQGANGGVAAPNGSPDEHIHVSGLASNPTAIHIIDNTHPQGQWSLPFNGSNSSIFPIYDGNGNAELFFEGWQVSQNWHVKVTYANGSIDECNTGGNTVPVDGINDADLVLPADDGDAQNLKSALILNSGAYLSDGIVKSVIWTNPGPAIYVKKAYLWLGVDFGGRMDSVSTMRRVYDKSYLCRLQWDHYAEPTTPKHDATEDFGDKYMKISSGDGIKLTYLSVPIPPNPQAHAHHLGAIWFHY